jgi:chemotaxis protein CheD
MALPGDDLPRVNLGIGEGCIARSPMWVETVLGSCVAAVFWSRRLRIGAMCHAALPFCPRDVLAKTDRSGALRYVDYSIRHLLDRMGALGAARKELQVKLFGGADVLPMTGRVESVGSKNCSVALRVLEEESLVLTGSDLGGNQGRVIYFNSLTGEVLVRRLPGNELVERSARPDLSDVK